MIVKAISLSLVTIDRKVTKVLLEQPTVMPVGIPKASHVNRGRDESISALTHANRLPTYLRGTKC